MRFVFHFLILMLLINFNACVAIVSSDEFVMKKKDLELISTNSKRLIESEELLLLNKDKWEKEDFVRYGISPEINTQYLGLIGAYMGLRNEDLISFSKDGRLIKEVQDKISKELERRNK